MISETKFASAYGALWRLLAPNMEQAVRQINLRSIRYCDPLSTFAMPERLALLNEIAFRGTAARYPSYLDSNEEDKNRINSIALEVSAYLLRFGDNSTSIDPHLSDIEMHDILSLSQNIRNFIVYCGIAKNVEFYPKFTGCGIINKCSGDIYGENMLIEVKSGNRKFRSVDFRQIITYCALSYIGKNFEIEYIICVNPRRGIYTRTSVLDFIRVISGGSPAEFFHELQIHIAAGGISR